MNTSRAASVAGEVSAPQERVRLTIEIDGDSLQDVVNRLYDLGHRLSEPGRILPVQMVGGHHIVTVREVSKAPKVDWREAEGA